jgi:hypothetical protein
MNKVIVCLLLVISSVTYAKVDLRFKSVGLNKVVSVFNTYSPDLLINGELTTGSCGTYNANFVIKKVSEKDIVSNYILHVESGRESEKLDFNSLELSPEKIKTLTTEIESITDGHFQHDLRYTSAKAFYRQASGVIFSYDSTYTAVIADVSTNEYLILSGDTQQDDCD